MDWKLGFVLRLKSCFVTGKMISGLVMVCKDGNRHLYRSLSPSEQREYVSAEAW